MRGWRFRGPPPGGFHHQGGQSQQSQGVGKDHELIKQVGQGPHQVIGQTRAQEDEHHPKHRVDGSGSLAEEIGHVELAKEVPAEDGGKREEKEAYSDCLLYTSDAADE